MHINLLQVNFLIAGHSSLSPSTCSNNVSNSNYSCRQRYHEDSADILSENLHMHFQEVKSTVETFYEAQRNDKSLNFIYRSFLEYEIAQGNNFAARREYRFA